VKRILKLGDVQEMLCDVKREAEFEEGLARMGCAFEPVFAGGLRQTWCESSSHPSSFWNVQSLTNVEGIVEPISKHYDHITRAFRADEVRKNMRYTPEMLVAIKAARREKVANKTRELMRERQGEILRRSILRQNKGPPAHILARMTPEQRQMDKVARSVSEVGCVAQVKRKLGFKLRNPDAWKAEDGGGKDTGKLAKEIMKENTRRMAIQEDVY